MNIKKTLICVILFLLIINMSACGRGEELLRIDGKDRIFVIYGGSNAITRVDVLHGEDKIASVDTEYRVNEPWLGEDKEDYGFRLCDLNGDGVDDFVIKTVRTPGEERYLFYVNKKGEYKLERELSNAVAPAFGEGDGKVLVTTFERYDQPQIPGEPAVYELRQEKTTYAWSEYNRLQVIRIDRFSYFSETDIYKYSVFLPNEEGEFEADTEEWIYPDKLDKYGLSPLK